MWSGTVLRGFTEAFAAKFAVHAPCVDAEEQGAVDDETRERRDGGNDVTAIEAEYGGGGEARWKKCGDGLNEVKDFEEQRKVAGNVMMARLQAGVEVEVDVLEAE